MGKLDGHLSLGGGAADLAAGAWNGTFHESFDAVVTSDGVTITMSLELSGGGDLTMNFSDGDTTLDCTPAQTIALTAGTDTSPQANYIYIPQATKVLTKSTSDWPAGEHIRVGFFFVQSATAVQTNGALVNQNWNDHFQGTDGQGHITHVGAWVRRAGASWFSGVNGAGSDDWIDIIGASSPDDVYFKSSSGEVSQMHLHSYPAKDSSAGDEIFITNHDTTPYTVVTNLNTVLTDASGGSLSGRYFSFVFMGVANKGGEYGPLLMMLPTGSYGNATDAINDVSRYDVYTPPREFVKDSSTGFHICRVTFQHGVGGGGTWTVINTDDLRNPLGGITGGGAGGGFSIGTQDQIPHVNVGGTDFDYSADITWDDERLDIVGATGTENINIGEVAGGGASAYAVNIGYQAGRTATGDEHVAIGRNAGDAATGDACVFIGAFAGQVNAASSNTFIGHGSGDANGNGGGNVFVGTNAGGANTTGGGNTFLGAEAGQGNATGQYNTFVGQYAGGFNNNTSESVALGYHASEYAQGAGNISVGFEAFENAVLTPRTGTYGVALGYKAGESDATGDYVISIGYQAGQSNALNNVANIGQNAQATAANQFCVGTTYTTALLGTMQFDIDQVIGAGQDDYVLTYDNGTGLISLEAAGGGVSFGVENQIPTVNAATNDFDYDANFSWDGEILSIESGGAVDTILIGKGISTNITNPSNVVIGDSAAAVATSIDQNVVIGAAAGAALSSGNDNVLVGYAAGDNIGSNSGNTIFGSGAANTYNTAGFTAIGYQAAGTAWPDNYRIAIGYQTAYTSNAGDAPIDIGYQAGYDAGGNYRIAIGYQAAYEASAADNIAIGYRAGYEIDGIVNIAIGNNALGSTAPNASTGCVVIGHNAASVATGVSNSVVIGYIAGQALTTGDFNTLIGSNAGNDITIGTDNTFVGYLAGSLMVSGNDNTFVGSLAGQNSTGSGNVFLGYDAGSDETGDNTLYIENSNSATPLIYGEFDNDIVRINGIHQYTQGTDLASANDMVAPDANYADVTGVTQINTMAATNWVAGAVVILQFDGSVTVKHATAGTGAQFQLAASADFSATAGDTLMCVYDGTFWREVSRTVI